MGRASKRETVDGERSRELREALQVSQAELANLLGVDRGTLARWETGTPAPVAPILAAALTCLDAGTLPRPAEHPGRWHEVLFARANGADLEDRLSRLRVDLLAERKRVLARASEIKASVPRGSRYLAGERLASAAGCLVEAARLLADDEGPLALLLAARSEERALDAALASARAGGDGEAIWTAALAAEKA